MWHLVFQLQILSLAVKAVISCHSTSWIPALFDDFASKIFKPFAAAPPPVARAVVIREGKCAGGKIEIMTMNPWDPARTQTYLAQIEHNIRRLEKYSGIQTTEFCPSYEKEPVKINVGGASYFGLNITFKYLTSTCDRLRFFVSKAVSWSDDIRSARVACECDSPVQMVRQ